MSSMYFRDFQVTVKTTLYEDPFIVLSSLSLL